VIESAPSLVLGVCYPIIGPTKAKKKTLSILVYLPRTSTLLADIECCRGNGLWTVWVCVCVPSLVPGDVVVSVNKTRLGNAERLGMFFFFCMSRSCVEAKEGCGHGYPLHSF
jgi:hypothetical protein